ncbi:MAG: FAD-binding oxidoreductase, partial [Chloroflexota bacterium]
EVVLADGTVCTTPLMPRWSIGPDMAGLFVGSEGTLGVITSVTLKIDRVPDSTLLRAVRFPTVYDGLASIREIVQGGVHPAVVRLYDEAESAMLRATTQHDGGGAVLLLGFVGPTGVARAEEDFALAITVNHGGADLGREPAQRWDANRLRVPSGFVALQERGVLADYIDVQASWSTVETVYAAVRAALAAHCDTAVAHFSHVYAQGTSIYFVVSIRAASDEEAVARHRAAWQAAMEAVVLPGGGIAHHHGVGRVRTPWLHEEVMRGAGDLWSIVRTALDPAATLSPDVLPHDPPGLVS